MNAVLPFGGQLESKRHRMPVRVYYEDTDAAGIVYHASYVRFAERGRTEMLRAHGFDHASMFKATGTGFAVAAIKLDYRAPAKLDDLLTVRTWVSRIGGASMDMTQEVRRGDAVLTEIKVTLVCIDRFFKAVRIPADVRKIYEDTTTNV